MFTVSEPIGLKENNRRQMAEVRGQRTENGEQTAGDRIQKIMACSQKPVTRNQSVNSGFTLMEIMLAILMLGLVVTTVLASFNAVFSTTEALESGSDIHEMAKNCLKRMTTDLESAYVVQPPIYKPPEFDESPDDYRMVGSLEDIGGTGFAKIRFCSRAHLRFETSDRTGIAEIIYYVMVKEDGSPVLKRSDNLYPYPDFEEKGSDPTLCEHVKSLAFKYFDHEGSEYDEWDSESDEFGFATPNAIAIQLEIEDSVRVYNFETLVKLPVYRQKIE
jgi:general secretion pathway protein J